MKPSLVATLLLPAGFAGVGAVEVCRRHLNPLYFWDVTLSSESRIKASDYVGTCAALCADTSPIGVALHCSDNDPLTTDKCGRNKHGCSHVCLKGYVKNAEKKCVKRNQCGLYAVNPCNEVDGADTGGDVSACVNTGTGTYTCRCKADYWAVGTGAESACVQKKCIADPTLCGTTAACVDVAINDYRCDSCSDGYGTDPANGITACTALCVINGCEGSLFFADGRDPEVAGQCPKAGSAPEVIGYVPGGSQRCNEALNPPACETVAAGACSTAEDCPASFAAVASDCEGSAAPTVVECQVGCTAGGTTGETSEYDSDSFPGVQAGACMYYWFAGGGAAISR